MTTHTNSPSLGVESTQTEGSPMTSRTYTPSGTGLCGECGHDVGAHDDRAHEYAESDMTRACGHYVENYLAGWIPCSCPRDHPIHDVGRELRCPEEAE